MSGMLSNIQLTIINRVIKLYTRLETPGELLSGSVLTSSSNRPTIYLHQCDFLLLIEYKAISHGASWHRCVHRFSICSWILVRPLGTARPLILRLVNFAESEADQSDERFVDWPALIIPHGQLFIFGPVFAAGRHFYDFPATVIDFSRRSSRTCIPVARVNQRRDAYMNNSNRGCDISQEYWWRGPFAAGKDSGIL